MVGTTQHEVHVALQPYCEVELGWKKCGSYGESGMFSRLAGQVWVVTDWKERWDEAEQPLFLRFVG